MHKTVANDRGHHMGCAGLSFFSPRSLQATLSAASSRGPEEGPRTAREKYSQRRMENFTQREISASKIIGKS